MNSQIQKFINHCKVIGMAHPELQEALQETYELMMSEIEDNGMFEHELELAYGEVEELLEDLHANDYD